MRKVWGDTVRMDEKVWNRSALVQIIFWWQLLEKVITVPLPFCSAPAFNCTICSDLTRQTNHYIIFFQFLFLTLIPEHLPLNKHSQTYSQPPINAHFPDPMFISDLRVLKVFIGTLALHIGPPCSSVGTRFGVVSPWFLCDLGYIFFLLKLVY